ncbi:MAG: DUF1145 domain-containing protein [Anaerolineae bacterium]|nr:DUF1145 domain-containing protein [Anaerolineae bacterium]
MLAIGELVIVGAVGLSLALMFIFMTNNQRRKQKDNAAYDDEYESIRRRIGARYKRRGEFALHVVFYLFMSLIFWFLVPMPKMAALWLSAAWGLVVLMHLVKLLFDEAQERAVDREIDRIRSRDAESEKPKHQHMEVAEDGELVEIIDDQDGETPQRLYQR